MKGDRLVQMLGEGFDHPKLSVAAIFRPFRSLARPKGLKQLRRPDLSLFV